MAKMTLTAASINGGSPVTFAHNPKDMDKIEKRKSLKELRTFNSAATINFPFLTDADGLVGSMWELGWPYMPIDPEFANLQAFFELVDEVITWNPTDMFAKELTDNYTVILHRLESTDMRTNITHKEDIKLFTEIRTVV